MPLPIIAKMALIAAVLGTAPIARAADTQSASNAPDVAAHRINDAMTAFYRDAAGSADLDRIFNALGALSGFGCQIAIREGFVRTGMITADKAFVVVTTKDGGTYYFGDMINGCLFGSSGKISVWSLVIGAATSAGARDLPDRDELVARTARAVGTADFGIPRDPPGHPGREHPIDVLHSRWEPMRNLLTEAGVDPRFWGWTFALAAQQLIVSNAKSFDPAVASKIVVEAAVPMSKISPAAIGVSEY